jgi:type II secretory pathway component GspD/PulD (secretin)
MTAKRTLLALSLALLPLTAFAQDPKPSDAPCSKLPTRAERTDCQEAQAQAKTFYLKNINTQNEANEITVAIRNVLDPGLKIYLVWSQNALLINADPEQLAKAEAIIRTLDIPHKTYRLTYTITELDAGKTVGTEHLSMVVVDGQHSTVKEGDKIPVATGSYSNGEAATAAGSGVQTQFTYLDIGLNFDSTLNSYNSGAILKTKVEQSSLGQPSTIAGIQEPVVRQSVFEGIAFLPLGKPVMLGSIDVPNSTRRLDIAVVMEDVH